MSIRDFIAVDLKKRTVKGKYTYYFLYWSDSNGKPRRKSLGNVNKISRRQARVLRVRREQELNRHPAGHDASIAPTLSEFSKKYVESRKTELAPGTLDLHRQTIKYLLAYFGTNQRIDEIAKAQTRAFKTNLANGELIYVNERPRNMKSATVELHIRNAKTLFNRAIEDDILLTNPFEKLSRAVRVRKDWSYMGLIEFSQLLDACPNRGWRMLLALCRLAGLRQAEALNLTWREVDWDHNTLAVWAPKTDYSRIVPICPELLPLLEAAFESAKEGETKIVVGLTVKNLWRDFQVIRKRAGVPRYKKWCHTLRKNREYDWSEKFPSHVVAEWMGHSPDVAHKHYLRVHDRNIEAATTTPIDNKLAQKAAQNDKKKDLTKIKDVV